MAAGLGRRAGPAPGTDDWHADRPAVVAAGARAGVKEKMAARARHRENCQGKWLCCRTCSRCSNGAERCVRSWNGATEGATAVGWNQRIQGGRRSKKQKSCRH